MGTRRSLASNPNDAGSALPMFIFGVVFLLFAALAVISSSGLLEQQRRLNGASDTIALSGVDFIVKQELAAKELLKAATKGNGGEAVDLAAETTVAATKGFSLPPYLKLEIDELYPGQGISLDSVESPLDGHKVKVRLCQYTRSIVAAVFAGGHICVTSAADDLG